MKRQNKTPFEYVNQFSLNMINEINDVISNDKGNSIILCYHSVGNNNYRFSNKPSDFAAQVEYLVKNFEVVSLDEILKSKKGKRVAITFDDGYEDILKNALPILEKYQIKATMFVLGDIKKANRKELDNNLKLMTNAQIKKLYQKGWEIGYHTKTHADLDLLNDKELEEEISLSKKRLEKELGIKMKYFAYPRGKYSDHIIKVVKRAGFKAAFTVDGAGLDIKKQTMFTLSRVPMEGEINLKQFGALISPLGIMTTGIFMNALKLKERYLKI